MTSATDPVRNAFKAASDDFVSVVASISDQWHQPGLGEWTVRELVGHTARAFVTIETYVHEGATVDDPTIPSPAGYFAAALRGADHAAIAQRGREAATTLGADPAGTAGELRTRVVELVGRLPDETLMDLPWGSMRLVDYLPTRLFELAVHTADLRAALGRSDTPPPEVTQAALGLITGMYGARGDAPSLLRALTGRVATSTIAAIL